MTQLLTIWYITDDKPGHLNQLRGLSAQLNNRARSFDFTLNERWIDYTDPELNWQPLFKRSQQRASANKPSIVIGAGHRTHLKLIALGRRHRAYTVVLMRPTLPLKCFDAAIVPMHDNPPDRRNVLATRGVLNAVRPQQRSSDNDQNPCGLILIGGKSKHFSWNGPGIVDQITKVLEEDLSLQWVLSNSRRTPVGFTQELALTAPANLQLVDYQQTDAAWLPNQIQKASKVWVTPDSVSMVYEAITAGVPTGLLALDTEKPNRINFGIQQLVNDGMATEFKQWQVSKRLKVPVQPLWEADRAAQWLFEQFQRELTH